MKWTSSTYNQSTTNTTTDGAVPRPSSTGKELDEETGFGYFGARYMDHELMTSWLSVDPMSDKYPGISPYAYCAWNPVKLVDPDGRDVLPTSEEAYQMILMTVPESAREYIQRDEKGYIDRNLINTFDCESSNFRDLKELVNNDCIIEVSVSNSYNWINGDGNTVTTQMEYRNPAIDAEFDKLYGIKTNFSIEANGIYGTSTGESGEMGVTALPTQMAGHRSTNENIQITINAQLSAKGRIENFIHEFYGHAYIYSITGDANRACHDFSRPKEDGNIELRNRILHSQNEASNYYK